MGQNNPILHPDGYNKVRWSFLANSADHVHLLLSGSAMPANESVSGQEKVFLLREHNRIFFFLISQPKHMFSVLKRIV